MQAEGIRAGDVAAEGWTAVEDALTDDGYVYLVVERDGVRSTLTFQFGEQIDLSWGAGVKYPPGTPEYEAYAADLRAELAKFANQEPPYDRPVEGYPGAARDAGFGL